MRDEILTGLIILAFGAALFGVIIAVQILF